LAGGGFLISDGPLGSCCAEAADMERATAPAHNTDSKPREAAFDFLIGFLPKRVLWKRVFLPLDSRKKR
ncbi:MAG: hypothetical protein VW547_09695, partial [Alphaproteobacteria bacterium]